MKCFIGLLVFLACVRPAWAEDVPASQELFAVKDAVRTESDYMNLTLPVKQLKEGEELLRAGHLLEAENLLLGVANAVPSKWKPLVEAEKMISVFSWDQASFDAYVQFRNDRQLPVPERGIIWSGPSYSKAFYLLGFIQVEQKKWEDGLKYLEQALAFEPDNPSILCEKAYILAQLGRYDEAYKLATSAQDILPWATATQRGRAMRGSGSVLIDLKRLDEAEALFKRSLEIDPENDVAKKELLYIERLKKNAQ